MSDELNLDELIEDTKRPHCAFSAGIVLHLIARIRELDLRVKQNDIAYMNGWNDGQRAITSARSEK